MGNLGLNCTNYQKQREMAADRLKENYARDGYLTGIDVFSPGEIAAYREYFDHLEERVGRDTAQIGLTNRHFEEEFIWRLVSPI